MTTVVTPLHPFDTDPWWHLNIEFPRWADAEQTTTEHIAPALLQLERDDLLRSWWFIRKHPTWRLRLRSTGDPAALHDQARELLDTLTTRQLLTQWWSSIYEPETAAFGGNAAIDVVHDLFHTDSRELLAPSGPFPLGQRELGLLLPTALFQGAGAEWYEQGDIWHRITGDRPLTGSAPGEQLTRDTRMLLTADTRPDGPLFAQELAGAREWAAGFHEAGQLLGAAARGGTLERGLRGVLSYIVIFHWNRLGLSATTQACLAAAARAAVLDLEP